MEFNIGDKIKIVNQSIIDGLRAKHKILRLLKETGDYQTFIMGSGSRAGQRVSADPREESDYLFNTIEGFVFKVTWMAHPTGDCVWERDKFQSLDVMLQIGDYSNPKEHWVEKVEDGDLPECVTCDGKTRNWIGGHWSCISCVERGITTKVSKPCNCCGCPSWDHGGPGGCFGSPHQEVRCGGCAGFDPDESADDIICSQERYDELLEIQERWAEHCRGLVDDKNQ